jgi:hypothetical protein
MCKTEANMQSNLKKLAVLHKFEFFSRKQSQVIFCEHFRENENVRMIFVTMKNRIFVSTLPGNERCCWWPQPFQLLKSFLTNLHTL